MVNYVNYLFIHFLNISSENRMENGEFEDLEITPYSSPPDLPDVMKNQEAANGQEQVA